MFNYAGSGSGCELMDADLNAVMRRLDHDGDQEISFADFFNRLLPYFIYSGLGINASNQVPPLPMHMTPSPKKVKKARSVTSLNVAASRR